MSSALPPAGIGIFSRTGRQVHRRVATSGLSRRFGIQVPPTIGLEPMTCCFTKQRCERESAVGPHEPKDCHRVLVEDCAPCSPEMRCVVPDVKW
jgi:hypothetical protein